MKPTSAAWVILSALPMTAWAEGAINCGFAQNLCECSAVFEVLETTDDDPDFVAMLRTKAQELREQVYMWHGSSAGDRMVDSHVAALRGGRDDLQSTIDLAHLLARCDRYVTRSIKAPNVVVLP